MSVLRRWVQRPNEVFLRRVLFQIHLWTGIALGLYVLIIGVSGSVLVYRNELYRTFSPHPVVVAGAGESMTVEALKRAAARAYPQFDVVDARAGETPRHAVEITLRRGDEVRRRLLHPFTGEDLGNPVPAGYRFTSWLLDLHDNLLGGETGRTLNGIGALFVTLLCLTGAIIWWPGLNAWRGSLIPDRRANWKRFNWSLHSALGFWGLAFLLLWGVTGMYLSFPGLFAAAFDILEPVDESSFVERRVDRIQYWLAYLHFGRLGGRGIPGCGRGLCDSMTKLLWAVFGFVLPLMFVTGTLMWWNRVVGPAVRRAERRRQDQADLAGGTR
jgi:uncharacterized iron-regulated membrane protein